ncbi:hypothetical protein GCM10011512_01040 [Tersicoccus solisilvae]|uniref:DUF2231 domain-containing protein n=1 Tax=Tersicoccus solisilvae TaxID=1882339 RepID=A0ABQ1NJ16_9MICC|nr:DUF2231 domain-containing protein [Tersicoccus solisilvae]GGC78278.1 hypothetical protein GCM10011512_01040 [Tersicoccus solisilvae]
MLEFVGLPTHILLLHAVVVLSPLAAVGGILYAVVPRWRRATELTVAVLGIVSAGFAVLTASAGERLEEALPAEPLIRAHAEQGDLLKAVAVVFAGLLVLLVLATGPWLTRRLPRLDRVRTLLWLRVVLQVLTVLAGVFLVYQTVVTGHSGAAATWSDWRKD